MLVLVDDRQRAPHDVGLNLLVQRTTLGRSIRAVAEDREMAARDGRERPARDRRHVLPRLGAGRRGGVLVGLYYTQIDFFMGYSAGLKAFTAAVLGGIGNIRGAMLGGVILGLIESLAVTFLNPAYKDVVAFAILILTLVVRPAGLLGSPCPNRRRCERRPRRSPAARRTSAGFPPR